jgi:lysophospholipase L1-like esterase
VVLAVVLLLAFLLYVVLWIRFTGEPVARPKIPRGMQTIGRGEALTYVVMGDSTAVSQGGAYDKGYAVASAEYLARAEQQRAVTWANVGVPGARAADVAGLQLQDALPYKPDVVLIGVGANDVTHLTSFSKVVDSLQSTIAALQRVNPQVRVVVTGAPDMGSVPRLPQPLRWYAGKRTAGLNKRIQQLADNKQVFFAPVAERTGPLFRRQPQLFAADKFHPTTEGYQTWVPVITETLVKAGL